MISYLQESDVLIQKLSNNSRITAAGFFILNKSLVTSFVATTLTYWIILIQIHMSY